MKVTFYIDPEGSTFAYFPDEIWDNQNNRTSYAHVGQHGACSPEYVKECKLATLEQYSDLLAELKNTGYDNLRVTNPKEKVQSLLATCKYEYTAAHSDNMRGKAMKANLKISKLPEDQFSVHSLSIKSQSDEPLGLILCSGEFLPVDMVCLNVSQLETIIMITNNFHLFYENL